MSPGRPASRRSGPADGGRLAPRWLLRAAAISVCLLAIAAGLWLVGTIVFAVPLLLYSLVAAVLAAALLEPVVSSLDRKGLPRWLAALGAELALLGLVLGALTFMSRRVMAQALDVSQAVDEALTDLQAFLSRPPLSLSDHRIEQARQQVVDYVEGLAIDLTTGVTVVLDVLSGIALVVFFLFFLLKDGPRMWRWSLTWNSPEKRQRTDVLGSEVWHTLTSYTRGVIAVALIDAVGIGSALFFLGVPLWLPLTLLVFVGAFVPFLGALVSGILAVAVTAVTVGTGQALVVLAVVLLVQQLEGNVLQPLIVGRAVQLHPVAVMIAVTAGGLLAGIGGAVLAVPVTAVAYRLADLTLGPGSADDLRRKGTA